MKNTNGLKKRKIIIYYTITIVIPCIILGVLAYRGIKNDQALLERETRKTFQTASLDLMNNIVNDFQDLEEEFLRLTDNISTPQNSLFSDNSLAIFIDSNPAISGVFFLDKEYKVSLLDKHILYNSLPTDEKRDKTTSLNLKKLVEQGWGYEFRLKDYKKAIRHYRNANLKIVNDYEKAIILNTIARLQKKNNQRQQALKTYETLLSTYSNIYIDGEIPIGIVSLLESSKLYLEIGNTTQYLNTINTLINDIKNVKWKINYATFSNIIETISENKNASKIPLELLRTTDNLLQDIFKSELKGNYLLGFKSLNSSSNLFNNSENYHHLTSSNGDSYFIFFNKRYENRKWGLIYNQDFLLREVLKTKIQELSKNLEFEWGIINNNGNVLNGKDKLTDHINAINISFPKPLPPWTLVILPLDISSIKSFVFSNQSIFFYIFLLILILLAFGLYFTMFNVNNEMRISQLKSNFISTVSHEFKSPLTAIQQMAEMLNDGRVPSDDRKQKYYTSMLKETNRLSLLINNMLDFSKMEVGQKSFYFEKGNLADITEEMVLSMRNYWGDKDFEISFIINKVIPDSYFDKESIKQVLQNLIDNACKYSGSSKKVDIEITTDTRNIILSVKDYGIGVKKEDQKELFNRFFRSSDLLTQLVKGSGIGLTIVKQIIEKHRGELLVISEYGEGSQFQVKLPIKKANG